MRERAQLDPGPHVWGRVRPFSYLGIFLAISALTLVCAPPPLNAQETAGSPGLQHRASASDDDADTAGLQAGRTHLPPEASGEYSLHSAEIVQITIQDNRVSGYISRMGDRNSDKGTPLTYFFRLSTIHNAEITFTTRGVHGVWYSFAGEIVRGATESSNGRSGFLLVGTLTEHTRNGEQGDEVEQAARVRLPHLPEGADSGNR